MYSEIEFVRQYSELTQKVPMSVDAEEFIDESILYLVPTICGMSMGIIK